MNESRWLNSTDAAAYLGMKREVFMQKVRSGVIPAGSQAIGPRSYRWRSDELDAFMSGELQNIRRQSAAREKLDAYIRGMAAEGPRRRRRRREQPGHDPQ